MTATGEEPVNLPPEPRFSYVVLTLSDSTSGSVSRYRRYKGYSLKTA